MQRSRERLGRENIFKLDFDAHLTHKKSNVKPTESHCLVGFFLFTTLLPTWRTQTEQHSQKRQLHRLQKLNFKKQ